MARAWLRGRPAVLCRWCGQIGLLAARECCVACYHRWRRAGWPADGPPRSARDEVAYRQEEVRFLRSQGCSQAEAARQLGVSVRTADRYETRLRWGAA